MLEKLFLISPNNPLAIAVDKSSDGEEASGDKEKAEMFLKSLPEKV